MTPEKHKENTIRAMLLDARKLGIIVDPADEEALAIRKAMEIKYFGELQEKENP